MEIIISIVLLLIIAASVLAIFLFQKPIKTWLCERKICGVLVPANSVIPVYQGGSVARWALPFGYQIISGKLTRNKVNGVDLPPGNPGDSLGIWWEGWFAWFHGIRFPKIKEGKDKDGKPLKDKNGKPLFVAANKYALTIEKIRKISGVSPDKPIDEQFERFEEAIDHLKININRFIVLNNVEMKDGSTVNVSLYAVGGVVIFPDMFWVLHGKDAFGIWESQSESSFSELTQHKSFEEFFRGTDNPYSATRHHLNNKSTKPNLTSIGIDEEVWKMDNWEDDSSQDIKDKRAELPAIEAAAAKDQEQARQDVKTAELRITALKKKQEVAKEELKRRLFLAGRSADAKELAPLIALAQDAGDTGMKILQQWLKVKERGATPDLSVLVEGGTDVVPQLQIKQPGGTP